MIVLSVQVLGPIHADHGGFPVDLGAPRQRAVLALLLAGRGRAVPVDRMINQVWRGQPPPKATASLQAYVSNLRRALEPGRPPRTPAAVLVSAPPGYALRLPEEAVDAWRFEAAVGRSRDSSPRQARHLLEEALSWWHGSAYAEVADEEWAAAEVARLTELHLVARELLIKAILRTGLAAEAVPSAEVLVREQPLREEGWRLLALALWGSGRQADALAALRRARTVIGDELGVSVGHALAELHQAVLTRRTEVLRAAVPVPVPVPVVPSPAPVNVPGPWQAAAGAGEDGLFVGRDAELRALSGAARAARLGGGVVLVSGEAGAGKSGLLDRFGAGLRADGWTVVAGRCPEFESAPPAWAWVELLRELAREAPPADPGPLAALLRDPASAPGPNPESGSEAPEAVHGDVAAGRFRLHRAFDAWLRAAAAGRPLAVVIDDVHEADVETLALLERAACLDEAPVLVVAAYRPTDAGDRLAAVLAEVARRSPLRLEVRGLPPSDVDTLVKAVCGGSVDPVTVAALAERTGGNPFYVWESARLLAGEGALVATSQVPQGVRDVLRRRLRRLPPAALAVLRLASAAGRETEVSILMEAADADEPEVLDGLEACVIAGLLTEPAPGRVRFGHALVRDTVYTDMVGLRRARLHGRLAETLRRRRPDDLPALAHHFTRAGTSAAAPLAVEYALRAAGLAERRYAHDVAAELIQHAIDAAALLPGSADDAAERLVGLLCRLLRVQILAGSLAAAQHTRRRAIDVAQVVARDDLAAAAFAAWPEPTPRLTQQHWRVDRAVVGVLDRLTGRTDLDPVTTARLLQTMVDELGGTDDTRVAEAARRQLAIARTAGDPQLLAAALTTMTKLLPREVDAVPREQAVAELRELTREHELPTYWWICEHMDGLVAATRNDPAAVRRHAEQGLEIAQRYRLAEAEAANLATMAMLAHVEGRFDEAEARYAEVRDRLRRNGSAYGDGLYTRAMITIRLNQGRPEEAEPYGLLLHDALGPLVGEGLAVVLAQRGDLDRARAVSFDPVPLRDHFYGVRLCSRARLAALLGDRGAAAELVPLLLPLRDQLGGAATTAFVTWPLAHSLGEVYRLLGDESEARRQFAHAETVARQWGSEHLASAARTAAAATRPPAAPPPLRPTARNPSHHTAGRAGPWRSG
ncbi:BTAD domain-containing putative transcriptional regulator [Streptomyces sp. NPDC005474]|uniref:BTAD domain-containing putative transcriptional regulator n=1 Tax=Streptomyces sp. NPDC005474 TaxID=3154878 RepID=UPI003456F518